MSIISLLGGNTDAAKTAEFIASLKAGKTEAQKKAIDFFYKPSGGCGCGSKALGSSITINQYIDMVAKKAGTYNVKQMAIDRIGLDESQINEIDPIVLSAFDYGDKAKIKYENKLFVSSRYSITWIFFSLEQMYTYKFIFDMTNDETVEYTNDFFYTDITRVATVREQKEKVDTIYSGCISKPSFERNVYVEDNLHITVPGFDYSITMNHNKTVDDSIQAAKAMIREKKYMK